MLRHPPPSPPVPYTTLFRSYPHPHHALRDLFEQLQPFPAHDVFKRAKSGNVAARTGQTRDEPCADRIGNVGEHDRSEEHTSELQSLRHLVCRLLLEKNNPNP